MEDDIDDFYNISQLLMEQDREMQYSTELGHESNSTETISGSSEASTQQETETGESDAEAEGQNQEEHNARQNRELNINEKRQIVDDILIHMEGDSLPCGMLSSLARKHGVHRSTTGRWFQEIKKHIQLGDVVDVRSKKLGKTGPKPKEYSDEWLMSVPLYKRTTNRSYGAALKVNHVVIHRLKKKGRLRAVTTTNHPALSDNHKVARLKWVLQHINPVPSEGDPSFMDLQHHIHIDEKWFYLNPETRTFYLTPNEEVPYRAQQSKRFKLKTMFMGMIGKPLYDEDGTLLHSGKYGLFPFVKYERAKKKSKNREAGTLETKVIQNVNREAIRDMIMNKIIPTIHAQWPQQLSKNIVIQWDNARPHQVPTYADFLAATQANGFNIKFVFQPAQSPDLNVLDLGLFKGLNQTHMTWKWILIDNEASKQHFEEEYARGQHFEDASQKCFVNEYATKKHTEDHGLPHITI
ncbi:uncharacterized protein LOC110702271 [Chenopodium quinoa]|uniref:uncharacterized protein LOC110702271 n=1 Tax=Chenopodium quinoa TaxID=63459 RepID=UPI000B79AD88|nr:uncharacterized protein LOC110702271 [Chenopodium quinoa]